jgi:hypothetical protein
VRKVRRILLIAATGIVLGGAIWLILCPRDPDYAGRPLHFWMEKLDSVSPGFPPPEVWGELGDDQIPVLIKALEIRDSSWRNVYRRLYARMWPMTPRFLLRRLPRPIDTESIAINSLMQLSSLGDEHSTNAAILRPAVPTLVHLLKTDKSYPIRMMAASELGFIGVSDANVIAALKQALNDDSAGVRNSAAEALKRINPH